jgi:hypothetical protein
VEPLSDLAVYGPLGVWAIAVTIGLVSLYRDIGRLRDTYALNTAELHKAHAAEIAELNENHAAKTEAMGTGATAAATAAAATFAQQLREQSDRHERQMAEAAQRSFNIMTSLADKMSALADSITRNRR